MSEGHEHQELLSRAPTELHRPLRHALDFAQTRGLVDINQRVINPYDFYTQFLESPAWKDRREQINQYAQIFEFHDPLKSPQTRPLTEEEFQASRYKSLESEMTGGTFYLDPETGVVLDNMLHDSLGFLLLEAAVSPEEFDKSAEIFNVLADLKQGEGNWSAIKASANYDIFEASPNMDQGMHYRFQVQRKIKGGKLDPRTLEVFVRPGYYKVHKEIGPNKRDLDEFGYEDAEKATTQDILDIINLHRIIPGQDLPRFQLPDVARNTIVEYFRTPRIIFAYNPTYPESKTRDPQDTRALKVGIVSGQTVASLTTENPNKKRSYYEFHPLYLHQALPLPNISRHIQPGKTPPYPAMGYHFDKLSKSLLRQLPTDTRKLIVRIQHEAKSRQSQP